MERIQINIKDEIEKILPEVLIKDIQENERICPTCHGLGMIAIHNVYGIKNDTNPDVKGIHFSYDQQSLSFCPSCYNGVQKLCEYCGKPIQKGRINLCDCDTYKEKEKIKENEKYQVQIDKAKQIEENEAIVYLYCYETDKYYDNSEEFMEEYYDDQYEDFSLDLTPKLLWNCKEEKLSIDAANVLESACEDLHEDANDSCDYAELQKILNDYCDKQSGTITYYPAYDEYIKVDWESYLSTNK